MNRPEKLDKRFGWCRKSGHGVFFDRKNGCPRCNTNQDRKNRGLCLAQLHHGPGHQSSTYCEVTGKHKIHRCIYGSFDQEATWTGSVFKRKFTGYFDEPPHVKN